MGQAAWRFAMGRQRWATTGGGRQDAQSETSAVAWRGPARHPARQRPSGLLLRSRRLPVLPAGLREAALRYACQCRLWLPRPFPTTTWRRSGSVCSGNGPWAHPGSRRRSSSSCSVAPASAGRAVGEGKGTLTPVFACRCAALKASMTPHCLRPNAAWPVAETG